MSISIKTSERREERKMKLKTFILTLALVADAFCEENCTPSADDLVSLLETEVDSYDQFIYGRYLTENEDTCKRVVTGMVQLRENFKEEMSVILGAAVRQLKTVQDTAKDTDAGPCVDRIIWTLERDTNEEHKRFQQCLDAPAAQLRGFQDVLQEDIQKYADLKDRSKAALKSCLVNLPSSCPKTTSTCMNTQIDYFNTIARGLTENRIVRSPCMGKFVEALQCFSKSVEKVIKKTKTVQQKTTACISFEDKNVARQSMLAFAVNVTMNWTVLEQVKSAQKKFEVLNNNVVKTLGRYYALEKAAKMTYEFRPHTQEHFKRRLDTLFTGHMSSVEEVRRSKRYVWPESVADSCCDQAISAVQSIINQASYAFELCEQNLLRTTQTHIERVRVELGSVIKDLSFMGDSVIMDCLNHGAILAENAVEGCYELHLRQFLLAKQDALEKVERSMMVLERYNSTYFNVVESTSMLCGNSYLNRTELAVDEVMFNLNRCPYKEIISDEDIVATDYQPTYDDNCYYYKRLHSWPYPSTDSYQTTTGYYSTFTTTSSPPTAPRRRIDPE